MSLIPVPPIQDRQLALFLQRLRDAVNKNEQELFSGLSSRIDQMESIVAGGNEAGGSGTEYSPWGDYTIPGAPSAFNGKGGFGFIIMEWAGAEQRMVAYTEIWRSADSNQANSVLHAVAVGNVYSDPVNPGETWYYWIRFVTFTNLTSPWSDLTGLQLSTAPNVDELKAQLDGALTESQLTVALQSRINLIDTAGTGLIDRTALLETTQTSHGSQISALETTSDSHATTLSSLQTSSDSHASSISTLETTQASQATQISQIITVNDSQASSITSLNSTTSGQATSISELTTTTDGHTATLATHGSSIAGLEAQWTVKTDVGGLVGGVGFYNNGTTTKFLVNADTFAVFNTSAGSVRVPFIVDGGTVYMDEVMIRNAAIKSAQIQSLAADKLYTNSGTLANAIIGNGHITNAMIGATIQSDNFVTGSAGWRVLKSGSAEFRNIIVRGDIEATSIKANTANIIDTLMLKGQAVTIPVSATSDASHYNRYTNLTTWFEIFSLTYTSTGAPAQITFFANMHFVGRSGGNGWTLRIKANGVVVRDYGICIVANNDGIRQPITLVALHTASSGSVKYSVECRMASGSTTGSDGTFTARTINVLETKR